MRYSSPWGRPILSGLILLTIAPPGRAATIPADLTPFVPGYGGIVFVQLPVNRTAATKPSPVDMLRVPGGEGGRLVLLAKDGSTRVLTLDFASAADPAVSFDGKRIIFAAKRAASDHWNIFEMKADGSGARQITRDMGNCRSPIYQSALFYLNDDRPSYQITFASDAAGELNEYGPAPATDLYSVRFDGSGIRRLTYAMSSSYDPYQMQDGRVLFSHWQRAYMEQGGGGRIDLFGIHLDGTDYAAFSGPQGRPIKHMACTTATKAVFVESDGLEWDGAGNLATLNLQRNLHSYRAVTNAADGLFAWPSPLPDGSVLVSRRSADGAGTHALYRLDLETGRRTLVFANSQYHSLRAIALAPRPEPDGHSSVVEDDQNWSKLYCLSVYENDLKREWMPPGTARRLRVIEGLPRTAAAAGPVRQRLLGDVELDEDGSFHLLVPPNTPIRLQIVDGNGMALRTSAWIWAKNKENRGCIGCHEDNERTPENVFAKALGHRAAELTLPPERRRTVDFQRDVAPVLTAKCAGQACHGAAAGRLDLGKYIDPGRARTSRLVWTLFGRSTARPWDGPASARSVKRMPPAGSPPLTPDERQAIIEWIDLGAISSAPASGGRR
jgi:hypothetical protein